MLIIYLTLYNELKNDEFNLKVERNIDEYLSCCIEESKDVGKLTMIQPYFLTFQFKIWEMKLKEKGRSLLLVCRDLKSNVKNQDGCS
jgi:hypothetical protein